MSKIHSATLRVIKGGRVTIPQEVREVEDIHEGDFVEVTIEKIEKHSQKPQEN
jgi:AbrB family looped-hinge helix DNA binding protein